MRMFEKNMGEKKRRFIGTLRTSLVFCLWVTSTAFSAVGCSRPVTESECDRAYDALIKIRTLGEPKLVTTVKIAELNRNRPKFLSACVGKVDRAVLNCWYSAKTGEQLKACDPK